MSGPLAAVLGTHCSLWDDVGKVGICPARKLPRDGVRRGANLAVLAERHVAEVPGNGRTI